MKRTIVTLLALLALAIPAAIAQADQGVEGVTHSPVLPAQIQDATAQYNGSVIDLSKGWGNAKACSIWHQGNVNRSQCFDSEAEMNQQMAKLQPLIQASQLASTDLVAPLYGRCTGSLKLWKDEGFSGMELQFYDRGVWQDLDAYSFNNVLSSFIVGSCLVHLSENNNGGGLWYPCNTTPYTEHGEMDLDGNRGWPPCAGQQTNWNDRVSSIYINP